MLLSILNNLSTTKRYSNTYKEMSFRAPRVLFTNLFPVSMREKNNLTQKLEAAESKSFGHPNWILKSGANGKKRPLGSL